MKGHIRHMFAGGNTSEGFFSYYHYILPLEDANRIISIKGGPGTGKSSLMKKIGEYFNLNGYDVEFHHCSSDNNSLDAVAIPKLKVAILDGTAPHVVDPKSPGAIDEILNLGQCWNTKELVKVKDNILSINKSIGRTFKRAYKYIAAAKLIHDSWSTLNFETLDMSKVNLFKETLKKEILKENVGDLGKERHLFVSAFTPNGAVTYVDSLYSNCKTVYVLNGEPGTCKSNILNYIYNEAVKRGHYVEVFHKPLIPEEIEHILIPDLSVALLTSNEINKQDFPGIQIYTKQFQNEDLLNANLEKIQQEKDSFYYLLDKSLGIISMAKELHDQLENYYIPNMDFKKLDSIYKEIINKFLNYEFELKNTNAFNEIKKDLFFI